MKYLLLFVLVANYVSCTSGKTQKSVSQEDKQLHAEALKYFKPLPASIIDTEKEADKIALGKKLYFENKLSPNNKISCNSCHNLATFGVDNEPTSPGHDGTRGGRNSPTSLNAALHFKQFWDGRAKDVEEQALGPILNPIEHGLPNEKAAMKKINSKEYMDMFKKAELQFNFKNVGVAIGAFERTLLTPSAFDDYLKGDINALNEQQRRGLAKFMAVGCTTCHSGVAIGGDSFQKLGVVKKYKTKDTGLHALTKKNKDKFKFKTPGLRNIAMTHPYFHDGSIKTLEEAIKIMAEYQLGKDLSDEEVKDIKAFLSSTTAKEIKY